MDIRALSIPHAWVITPSRHVDDRGMFAETFRAATLAAVIGRSFTVAQANTSVSKAGVVRGIHATRGTPGQAKYVTCLRGAVLDVVVDVRVGSPTFGQHQTVRLDAVARRAVYLSEGLGHAFAALTDNAIVSYLCSSTYDPAAEVGINPMDPALGIEWFAHPGRTLSEKDAAAPTLEEAMAAGLLPRYREAIDDQG